MRVLIIKTSSLGDIIHALPVIDYLHQAAPGIEIDWVVEEQFISVLEHNPRLNRIYPIKTRKWRKAPFSVETRNDLKALKKALRNQTYDFVFDIQGNLKSGLVDWLSGARERIGFGMEVLQEKINCLFTTRRVPVSRNIDHHITKRYLRVVSAPFCMNYPNSNLTSNIFSAPEDEAAAARYMANLPNGLVFLFQIGTTWNTKLWYPAGWTELARRLTAQYPGSTVVINWGNNCEKSIGEQIVRDAGDSVRLLPWLSIRELIPIIKRVSLVVGGDSGPLYLAAAVGTPTVSYYRATRASKYAPLGKQHRAIQADIDCAGCRRKLCDRDAECRRRIFVHSLFEAVSDLIGYDLNERMNPCCPT
ncbi:MAG: lipopolysaccharide heptosyltransferase I [Oryzomonas sp.]|uniref:lipopolysaccharide heptosyltransferase I n=1 Tax=Oryzomonas sp. TaxID=2855186 RepID=UPI002846A684|nr:lipopolysaccharide heptosyltransferase I [Oryzomonas sp.]MDR3579218.1 lipopolysaccharide heptosyltransferase I [Oryzomonas sp.]